MVLPVSLGTFLRIYQIGLQIPADDEWHALHTVMTNRIFAVATHLGMADHCIPLTLAFKATYFLYGLSETILRFPVLFAGITFLARKVRTI